MRRWKLFIVVAGVAIVAAGSTIGVDAALKRAAVVAIGGGVGIGQVKIVTNSDGFGSNNPAFITVPSATLNITVPALSTVVITADFTAETVCYPNHTGTPAQSPQAVGLPGQCLARIIIGPAVGYPQGPFSIDSTDSGSESPLSYEGHAMSSSKHVTNTTDAPRNVSVYVQVATSDTSTFISIIDWHLRAMLIQNGTGL
jgi:hypothetical protein